MKRFLIPAVVALFAGGAAAGNFEAARFYYALGFAGQEYCPNIKADLSLLRILAEASHYDPFADDEAANFMAQKQTFFRAFRSAPRPFVCEDLFRRFGPGTKIAVFQLP